MRVEEGGDFFFRGMASGDEGLADDELRAGGGAAHGFQPDVVAPEEIVRTRLLR